MSCRIRILIGTTVVRIRILIGTTVLRIASAIYECCACEIMQVYPVEFTIIKSRAMTRSRSPQCRAFNKAVMDEKSLSPL